MTAAVTANEIQDETRSAVSGGDHVRPTNGLDVSTKWTPILPVATIEQEKGRTDTRAIEETSESGIETEATADRKETPGEMTRTGHVEENGTFLTTEGRAGEEEETMTHIREAVAIERRAQPHHRRRRNQLQT